MSVREVNGRVVLLAFLVTLCIYLAAGGTSEGETAHAGSLNQTIPTMTPTGATSTPTVGNPTEPPPTQAPTEPPGEPSDTPSPTGTVPSSTPTETPTSGTATATGPATSTLTPTLPPTDDDPTPTLTQTPTPTTAPPTVGSVTGTAPAPTVESTTAPQPTALEPVLTLAPAEPTSTSTVSDLCGGSCLWIALGLILILAGIVLLVRSRRSEGGNP